MSYNVRVFSVMPPEFERYDLPIFVIDKPQHAFLPHKDVARIDVDCWLKRLTPVILLGTLPRGINLSSPRSRCIGGRGGHCRSWC